MRQNTQKFRGTGVALVTPFSHDAIDFESMRRMINHVIDGGVEYIVCLGTTGEATSLTPYECDQIIAFMAEEINGRVGLVYGAFGGNNTQVIIEKMQSQNFDGIDGILSSSPNYVKPGQEGIFRHFMKLADHAPRPIIMYNVPSRTASNMESETTVRLAESHENLIGIKEASGDMLQVMEIIKHKPKDFLVISGDDTVTFPLLACGGDGVISVISNAFPREFSEMVRTALAGDWQASRSLNYLLLDIHWYLYTEGSPVGIKGALEYLNLCSRDVRLPLVNLSEVNYTWIKTEIELAFGKKNVLTT